MSKAGLGADSPARGTRGRPKGNLNTAIFVDGLGRVLQTKKDVAIYQGEGKADTEMMVVSGRVKFDAFGRTVSALYPITEPAEIPKNSTLMKTDSYLH